MNFIDLVYLLQSQAKFALRQLYTCFQERFDQEGGRIVYQNKKYCNSTIFTKRQSRSAFYLTSTNVTLKAEMNNNITVNLDLQP